MSEQKLDARLLARLATRRPEWTFLLLGHEPDRSARARVAGLDNVRLLGLKLHRELPQYLAAASVGIVPYRVNDYTLGIDALKAYECLAAGLPVVATDLPCFAGLEPARADGTNSGGVRARTGASDRRAARAAAAGAAGGVQLDVEGRAPTRRGAPAARGAPVVTKSCPASRSRWRRKTTRFRRRLPRSVQAIADEIVVADGASSDGTRATLERYGARVIPTDNKLMLNINKNLAIAAARHEWVLLLDPDERVTPGLAAQLGALAGREGEHGAYWVQRRDFELGRWLRRASPQLRFFRNGRGRFAVSTSTRW